MSATARSILLAFAVASGAGAAVAADLGSTPPPPMTVAVEPPRYYLALRGGYDWAEDTAVKHGSTRIETQYGGGYLAAAGVGMHLDNVLGEAAGLRAELELGYLSRDVSAHASAAGLSKGSGAHGSVGTTYVLGSLYYDFVPGYRITPFVGAGAGFAEVVFEGLSGSAQGRIIDDRSTDLIYHGTAGVTFRLSPRWQMEAAYRYMATPSVSARDVTGTRQRIDLSDQILMLGARAHF